LKIDGMLMLILQC